jgi:hypothetical protein
MAIQEIETSEILGTKGGERGIDSAAYGLIMDIAQSQQYTKPIPSTIRELVSNAIDSQGEKERALLILNKEAKVSDFFIEREGDLYKDSKWDESYYDKKFLDTENNDVIIEYIERTGSGRCDSLIVRDFGVGIGGKRLEGVLNLGFSTKRNRKDALGSYGLGAKVGLSTGAEFYKITTVYNGYKYIIKVFNKSFNCCVGKLNLKTGEKNKEIVFSSGYTVYGEKTEDKNFTEIEVPSLKHHKEDYKLAVKTQLLYFKNTKFFNIDESGGKYEIDFSSKIIYNSKNLIISENSPFSKPHIIVVKGGIEDNTTGVCYGNIDFKELELEDMYGDVGIKCPIRQVVKNEDGSETEINPGIDVIPSRESVRWTANTRDFIKKQFNSAREEATDIVEKELKTEDFLEWLENCKNIRYKFSGSNSIIGRLSKILDFDSLEPKFNNSQIEFSSLEKMFSGFSVRKYQKYFNNKTKKFAVNRIEDLSWRDFNSSEIYFRTEKTEQLKDLFICESHPVIVIKRKHYTEEVVKVGEEGHFANKQIKVELLEKFLLSSKLIKIYEDVEITEEFIKSINKKEEEENEEIESKREKSPKEIRERENRTVCNTLTPSWNYIRGQSGEKVFINQKVEPKISYLEDTDDLIYYGTQEDSEKIHFAATLLSKKQSGVFWGENVINLVIVSKSNLKYFKSKHSHINNLFGITEQVTENEKIIGVKMSVNSSLVEWNTARKIYPFLEEIKFLSNYSQINKDICESYRDLVKFVNENYTPLKPYRNNYGLENYYNKFIEFIDTVEKIQEISESEDSLEEIKTRISNITCKETVIPEGTISGLAVIRERINQLENLLAYASPLKIILNEIFDLSKQTESDIPFELETEIKEYVKFKNK